MKLSELLIYVKRLAFNFYKLISFKYSIKLIIVV